LFESVAERRTVLWVTFWLAWVCLGCRGVPGGLVFMSEKIISICENFKINAVDALDREIDAVWGLIAIIEVLDRESRYHHYASGALRVVHNHLDALIAIRDGLSA
jgi:hypothetical protein